MQSSPISLIIVSNRLQAQAGTAASLLQSAVPWEGFLHWQERMVVYLKKKKKTTLTKPRG